MRTFVDIGDEALLDLRFLKAAILRIPLRKPELRLFSMSDIVDGDEEGGGGDSFEIADERVTGRCSLEEHEVGAVDWESIEPCLFDAVSIVVADNEEAMRSTSDGGGSSGIPRLRASVCNCSSRASSVRCEGSFRTDVRYRSSLIGKDECEELRMSE